MKIHNGNGPAIFMQEEQKEQISKMFSKIEYYFMYLWRPEHSVISDKREANKRDLKFAWVHIANTKLMCMIDIKTNKAYKLDGHNHTWCEWKKYTLIRWCTGFDL